MKKTYMNQPKIYFTLLAAACLMCSIAATKASFGGFGSGQDAVATASQSPADSFEISRIIHEEMALKEVEI